MVYPYGMGGYPMGGYGGYPGYGGYGKQWGRALDPHDPEADLKKHAEEEELAHPLGPKDKTPPKPTTSPAHNYMPSMPMQMPMQMPMSYPMGGMPMGGRPMGGMPMGGMPMGGMPMGGMPYYGGYPRYPW